MWQTFQLTQKANSGDVLAQHELGIRYLIGRGLKADTGKGAYWTHLAAVQNMVPARFNYGILLQNGWGVEWNPFEAYNHLLWCAEQGMPEAQYSMAQLLTDNLVVRRNWQSAYRWVRASADSGYEPAIAALPEFKKRGFDVDSGMVNPAAGPGAAAPNLQWTPVFLDFSPDTQRTVDDRTLIRDLLRSIPPDVKPALGLQNSDSILAMDSLTIEIVEKAANAGSPEALATIGRCYEKGIGVRRDPVRAAAYYVRAVRFDSPPALDLLWSLLEDPFTISELRTRASRGDDNAIFALATLTALGLQYPLLKGQAWVTESQAFSLLSAAARRGHRPSMIELGLCFFSGRWTIQDKEKALATWEDAGRNGSIEAGVRAAAARAVGESGHPDTVVQTLYEGLAEGSVLAQVALGYCHEHGFGVTRNKADAARLYRDAAVRGSQDAYGALFRMYDEIRPSGKEFFIGN